MQFQKIYDWIKDNFVRNKVVEEFIEFNNVNSPKNQSISNEFKGEALIELQMSFPAFIIYSYFCNFFLRSELKVIGYYPSNEFGKLRFFFNRILCLLSIDNGLFRPYRILRSMGVKSFIFPNIVEILDDDIGNLLSSCRKEGKEFILRMKIKNVVFGDLFYDWHLRKRELATIDVNTMYFEKDLNQFLLLFTFWYDYFANNNVKFVLVSHSVYAQGLVGRIGLEFGSQVFFIGPDRVHKITNERLMADSEFQLYEPNVDWQLGYKINPLRARKALKDLSFGSKITTAHTFVSGYKGSKIERIVREGEINILIASHCFSDSPHSFGDQLFPDYFEWLNFLAEFSKHSSFNWYIKAHPAFFESDKIHFNEFSKMNPHLIVVPSEYSNLELFKQGINVVLTVHGTIAFEAAYEDILVINASRNSPHVNYNFSLSPKSIEEFREMLICIPAMVHVTNIDKTQVEHFFDLHHLRLNRSVIFGDNYQAYLNFVGGYGAQYTNPLSLEFWLKDDKCVKNFQISYTKIANFIRSSNIVLDSFSVGRIEERPTHPIIYNSLES